jgi:RNA polymerase sigma-70 factor, ECF subfamily
MRIAIVPARGRSMPAGRLSDADAREFQRLVAPHLAVLVRTARFMTGSDAQADDLVQETMVKALQNFQTLRDPHSARQWLLTIQRRTFIDRYRQEQRYHEAPLPGPEGLEELADESAGAMDDHWETPQELLERFEDAEVIEALKSLPQEIRWTLMLVDVEQLNHVQAGQILDVPVGTVKSRAHRGRAMLRDRLWALAQRRGWVSAPSERLP